MGTVKNITEELDIAEKFQKECHEMVEFIDLNHNTERKITVQDSTNVWLLKKLAEFEIRLRELENTRRVG